MLYLKTMKEFMVLYQIFKKEVMTEVIGRKILFNGFSFSFKKNLKNFKEVV
jgi:hypothetical protein